MDPKIKEWLESFAECVRRVDYASARSFFHPEVTGYGSLTDAAYGIENLVDQQWKNVWPHIEDFRFDLDEMKCEISNDLQIAFIHTRWWSTGYHPDGTTFVRPGRTSLLLTRENLSAEWKAKYSHFSLDPGTPLLTQRPAPKRGVKPICHPA